MFKSILSWVDDRTGLVGGLDAVCRRKVEGGSCACILPAIAPMIVFCVIMQAVTGFFLWCLYSPSSSAAWESVFTIQNEIQGGWLVRGIHHFSAQLLVFLLAVYVVGLVFRGRYRAPREFVFWAAMVMGLLALGGCLTGDLLSWTSYGYSSTGVRTKFLLMLPVIGDDLFRLAIGGPGPELTSHTLTRFIALHIGVIGGGMIVLCTLWRLAEAKAGAKQIEAGAKATWYWPNRAAVDMAAWLAALIIVLVLVGMEGGAPLGAPADPAAFDGTARPEWSFRALYELVHLFPGPWQIVPVFIISTGIVGYFFAIPLIEKITVGPMVRLPLGHLVNVAVVAFVVLVGVFMTVHSYQKDAEDPEFQTAVAASERAAERATELAIRPEGIPPSGALSLVNNDPYIVGPRLYEAYCASCHESISPDELRGTGGVAFRSLRVEDKAEGESEIAVLYQGKNPSEAPNLFEVGSRDWIAGWLNEDTITSPAYYGNTPFVDGDMVDFVKSQLPAIKDGDAEFQLDEIDTEGLSKDEAMAAAMKKTEERLAALVQLLADEAALDGPRKFDDDSIEGLTEDDIYLFEDFGCTQCHKFYNAGVEDAIDLTGYGSRAWLIEFTKNPGTKQFYGKSNEMPAFLESADNAQLTEKQIELITDWMRGQWYRPTEGESEADDAE